MNTDSLMENKISEMLADPVKNGLVVWFRSLPRRNKNLFTKTQFMIRNTILVFLMLKLKVLLFGQMDQSLLTRIGSLENLTIMKTPKIVLFSIITLMITEDGTIMDVQKNLTSFAKDLKLQNSHAARNLNIGSISVKRVLKEDLQKLSKIKIRRATTRLKMA